MPKHKAVKFEEIFEPNIKDRLLNIVRKGTVKNITNLTLAMIAMGGVLTLAATAPSVMSEARKLFYRNKKFRKEEYRKIWIRFNKLKNEGHLTFVKEDNDGCVYKFTEKGKTKLKKFMVNELFIQKPGKWDKKWRLVIFDIPERYKKARFALRKKLIDMDFYQCQKSAWVHPFPCLYEIEFLKEIFKIKPFVKIFLVDEMTDGKTLYYFRNHLKQTV